MVLVESSHEDQGVPPRLVLLAGKVLAAAGVRRLLFQFGDSAKNAMYLSNNTNAVAYDELAAVDRTVEEVRAARLWLGTRPLIVITAGRNDGDQSWHRLQVDLLSHSSNSKRIVAQGSGHRVQDDRPDVVIAAIRDLIKGSGRLTRIPLGRGGEVTP
jgi:pimeloyl-ACP methyl ester carboxylesterase